MATYKKGYKKQTSEDIVLRIIIGIIGAVLLIVGFAFIYNLIVVPKTYDSFSQITKYAEIFKQKDSEDNQIDKYLVYFYKDDCTNCASIKEDVLKLANKLEKEGYVIYFVNTTSTTDDDTALDDYLTAINELSVKTPTLISVVDGKFEDKFIGTTDVLQTLNDVLDGDYEPFN